MSLDIDQFIRSRKQMLAEERKAIVPFPEGQSENTRRQQVNRTIQKKPSTPERPIADRLIEGDLQRQRYSLERQRDNQQRLKQSSPRRGTLGESRNHEKEEAALFGLRDSATIRKRREEQRNREYNEFKRLQEEKFQNRFSDKKGSTSQNRDNQETQQQYFHPEDSFNIIPQQSRGEYYSGAIEAEPDNPRMNKYESKVNELMRQVEELRRGNLKLYNENEMKPLPSKQMMPTDYEPSFYPPGALGRRQNPPQGVKAPGNREESEGSVLPLGNRLMDDNQKRQMRNREYNEFLRSKGEREAQRADLKRYGQSYHYEDSLTQRRLEGENMGVLPLGGGNFDQNLAVRNNEMSYETPSYSTALNPLLKAQITKLNDVEQRLHELESAYDNAKLTMLSKPPRPRTVSNLNGILDDEVMFGAGVDALSRFEKGERNLGISTTRGRLEKDGATLIVGRPDSPSTKRKHQELYRRELELQMQEQAAARRRQKEMDDSPVEGKSLPTGESFRQSQNAMNRSRSAIDLRQHIKTNDDDPYFYYANHNPLEGLDEADEPASRSFNGRRKSQQTSDSRGGRHVRFDPMETSQNASAMLFLSHDEQKKASQRQKEDYARELSQQMRESGMEKERRRKELEDYNRKKDEEIANFNPFGKGGGGAPMRDAHGNIVTDLRGRKADSLGSSSQQSPTRAVGEVSLYKPPVAPVRSSGGFDRTPRARSQSPTQLNALGEATFARGGHGIFGDPLSDEKKVQLSRYQADLQKQIAEQKQKKEIEKQREREEEEREMKRIVEQQKKMAQELEEEQKKRREKEEESRKQNEAAKIEAEQKRKEIEKKRQEDETRRLQNLRKETKPVYGIEETDDRPLPTLGKPRQENIIPVEVDNRPLPTLTKRRQETYNEADPAITQISELRRQIEAERKKVEAALQEQRNQVEVYDPRIEPITEVIVSSREPKSEDVFQRVISKHKASPLVHRTARDPFTPEFRNPEKQRKVNQENVREFKEMTALRRRPVETPDSVDKFETEQLNYIKSQEESLTRYKRDKKPQQFGYPQSSNFHSIKRPPTSDSMQLQSDSAFVEIPDLDTLFPSNPRNLQRKPSVDSIGKPFVSILNKDEDKQHIVPSNNQTFGSQTSLNVEELSKKNAERLRKLQQMQADNVSLDDPEEVLNRFMSRQSSGSTAYGRPSSNQSGRGPARFNGPKQHSSINRAANEDESWLNPSRMN